MDTGITANRSAITWQIEIVSTYDMYVVWYVTYPSLRVTLVLGKLIAAHILPHSSLKGYNIINEIKYKNTVKGTPRQWWRMKVDWKKKRLRGVSDYLQISSSRIISRWCHPGVHLRPAVSAGLGLGTRVSNGKVRTQEHSPGEPARAGYFYSNVSNSQFLNINEKEEKMNVKY